MSPRFRCLSAPVAVKSSRNTKSPGAILDVAPATVRRMTARDGGHKKKGVRLPLNALRVA